MLLSVVYCSMGGGIVVERSDLIRAEGSTVAHSVSARDIVETCQQRGETLIEYALAMELSAHGYSHDAVFDHLRTIWLLMSKAMERGLSGEGCLPGSLGIERRAADMLRRFEQQHGTPGVISPEYASVNLCYCSCRGECGGWVCCHRPHLWRSWRPSGLSSRDAGIDEPL